MVDLPMFADVLCLLWHTFVRVRFVFALGIDVYTFIRSLMYYVRFAFILLIYAESLIFGSGLDFNQRVDLPQILP